MDVPTTVFVDTIEQIREKFNQLGFVIEGDYEGEVSDVEAEDIDILDINFTELTDTEFQISFSVDVEFTADLSYDDYDSAIHDSEDDIWIALETVSTSYSGSEEVKGGASFKIENGELELDDLWFNSDTIFISGKDAEYY